MSRSDDELTPLPPGLAERFLRRALPSDDRGRLVHADLREEFYEIVDERGAAAARRWFHLQSIRVGGRYLAGRLLASVRRQHRGRGGRGQRGDPLLRRLCRHLHYSVRSMRKEPGFATIVVLTLALGIGGTTTVLSLLGGVAESAMPYPDASRLVNVNDTFGPERSPLAVSHLNFRDWQREVRTLDAMAIYTGANPLTLTGDGEEALRLTSNFVSPAYLRLLGARPVHGRLFDEQEDRVPMGHPVAVISHGLFTSRFGGRPEIVGSTITLGGVPYTVIGVLEEDFHGLIPFTVPTQIWVPAMMLPQVERRDVLELRRMRRFSVVGRLAPGETLASAQAEMTAIAELLEEAYPEANRGLGIGVTTLHQAYAGFLRRPVLALLAGAGLVLLIGCANGGALFLVRGASRARQYAVRLALGASPAQLAAQVLTEALLLSLLGAGLGTLLAFVLLPIVLAATPVPLPTFADIRLDGGVLTTTVLLAVVGGLASGGAAAWRSGGVAVRRSLHDSSRGGSGRFENRARHTFVALEVAVAVLVLIGAGLLLRSLQNLRDSDPGFSSDRLLTFRLDLPSAAYASDEQVSAFGTLLEERLRALPGVVSADLWGPNAPLQPSNLRSTTRRDRPVDSPGDAEIVRYHSVSPGAFERLGLRVVAGRGLLEQDRHPDRPVVVISQSLADRLFAGESPLGRYIRRFAEPGSVGDQLPWLEIVGVVGNSRLGGRLVVTGSFGTDHDIFYSRHEKPRRDLVVLLRARADPEALAPAVRQEVADLDSGLAVYALRSMSELLASEAQVSRFTSLLMATFSAIALFLAALGLYGALSYSLLRRTREIGLRSALGATGGDNLRLFVGQGMRLALGGTLGGLLAAFALTRLVTGLLFDVSATDPAVFAAAALLLLAVALLACVLPTLRAVRVDPMSALRVE